MRPRLSMLGRLLSRGLLAGLAFAQSAVLAESPPALRVLPRDSNGWVRLEAPENFERVFTLEGSYDLRTWTLLAKAHDRLAPLPDLNSAARPHRFYRLLVSPRSDADDWKNQIQFPLDPFLSPWTGSAADEVRWVKFAILRNDPTRVYFQDSSKYTFHYDFAVKRLPEFAGWTRAAFDAASLRLPGQQIVLGAVLFPPIGNVREFGIQFVGLDPYPKEMVADLFRVVQAMVASDAGVRAFYIPTFEQTRVAEAGRAFFLGRGISLSSLEAWLPGNQTYSSGWAIGRLKFFPAAEIARAFADGRLLPQDILLTDGVPAEIPVVAGVISLAPSTPNSHVAILSRSFGIPFVYLAEPAARANAQALTNREVVLRATQAFWKPPVELFALDARIEPALKGELLNLKVPPPVRIAAKKRLGAFSASTQNLTPADIQYFGGKAANFGLLRRSIASNAPVAIAFSFDLWDAFLDQALAGGKTLRTEIRERLSSFSYPPNMPALATALAEVRKLITDTARFSPELQQAVLGALKPFDTRRNIRFRSSTNVEDSEQFTGAGLYDSFSGCMADDLDGDTTGPSHCDPTESKERGVFRAIQKVYASFYNDNAFLERLRHRVNEEDVGMGLLVHYSTPDAFEMANGVATLRYSATDFSTNLTAELVTQLGAVSVSNPDSAARPEVVTATVLGMQTYFEAKARSSLVQLGGYVLEWENDYRALMQLFRAAMEEFPRHHPAKTEFILDFEYKKEQPGRLSVKQIREIPDRAQSGALVPYLLNTTNAFVIHQGEFGDVFSNHRLKAELALQTRNLRLTDTNLAQSLYTDARVTLLDGAAVKQLDGALGTFPDYRYSRAGDVLTDQWVLGTGNDERRYSLITELNRKPRALGEALLKLDDFKLVLTAEFRTPVPILDFEGNASTTTRHEVLLQTPLPSDAPSAPVERKFRGNGGLDIQTRFHWYQPRSGGIGLKTAPLLRWDETRISGLTPQPIVLRGYYSQTYRPGHHNFTEEFIFEPGLEPGLSAETLAALQAANIRLLHIHWGEEGARIHALGWDGKFRRLSP